MAENQEAFKELTYEQFEELKHSSYLIDTRQPEIFASCYIKNSINIPGGGSFGSWAAMVIPNDQPLILIVENQDTVLETIELLSLVGLRNIIGFVVWTRKLSNEMDSLELLPPKELSITKNVFIVDVRTLAEWNFGHIQLAHHMELANFNDLIKNIPADQKIALICGSGFRASIAASILQSRGYKDVANVQGGMQAWKKSNLPIVSLIP